MKATDAALIREFSSWVGYVELSNAHLLPGNWLEYEAGQLIPGTNVAGFLVARPTTFLDRFPVGAACAYWHSLVPVSLPLLNLAKQTNALQVVNMVEDRV